jgi:ArsR family metal-binding transcriptional regulator
MDIKFKIAKLISGGTYTVENPDYEQLLQSIYDNKYKAIEKCPIDLYILGIVESFVIKDVNHANKILNKLKEVTQEVYETTGIECTFTDEDWGKLQFINNPNYNPQYKWSNKLYILSEVDKCYMGEFFEN